MKTICIATPFNWILVCLLYIFVLHFYWGNLAPGQEAGGPCFFKCASNIGESWSVGEQTLVCCIATKFDRILYSIFVLHSNIGKSWWVSGQILVCCISACKQNVHTYKCKLICTAPIHGNEYDQILHLCSLNRKTYSVFDVCLFCQAVLP